MGRKAGIDSEICEASTRDRRNYRRVDPEQMDPSLEGPIGDYLKGQLPQEAIHLQMDRLLTQAIGTLERWVTPYLQPTTPLSDLDEAFEQMDGLPQLSRSRRRVVSLPRVSSLPSTETEGCCKLYMANGCWGGEFIKCIKRKVTATHTKRAMAGGSKGAAAIDSAPVTHAVLMAAPGLHTAAQVFGPLRVRCRLAHAVEDLRAWIGCGAERRPTEWGREKADRSVVKPASWPHPTHGSCGWYPQQGVPVTAPKVLAANTQGVVAVGVRPSWCVGCDLGTFIGDAARRAIE